jgi:hypothetical protein
MVLSHHTKAKQQASMTSKMIVSTPYIPNLQHWGEATYGRIWMETARREGHRPQNLTGAQRVTKQSKKRAYLRNFFTKTPEDVTVKDIQAKVAASSDTIRRCCMEFVKEGWLAARRTKDGYYFTADIDKLTTMIETKQV